MQEVMLYRYWEYYASVKKVIFWRGNTLKIISSGTLNEHEGPDYQGARFEFNGVLYQGAVEMHINLNDWYNHQHHYDPAYKEVQLHIINTEPEKKAMVGHKMRKEPIPTFVLPMPSIYQKKTPSLLCSGSQQPLNVTKRLQQLALNRLSYKVHSIQKELDTFTIQQLFYRGYLRAMGYPHNKHVFEWLALRVSIELINKYKNSPVQLLALYLGSAGFLDENFHGSFAGYVKETFNKMSRFLSYTPLAKTSWQFAAVRPLNHPHFRLAGWVALLSHYSSIYIFDLFLGLIQERMPYKILLSNLQEHLQIKPGKYWQRHYALDKPTKQKQNKYFFGQQRIKEIIVNLFIPLSLADAHNKKAYGFISYLEELYLSIPGACSYQSLYRRKPWLKRYKNYWNSFNLGQALIELEENFCIPLKCTVCPLASKRLKPRSLEI